MRSSVFYTLSSPDWLGSHSVPVAPDGCGIPSNAERNCASPLLPRRSADSAMRCKPVTLKGLCHRRILAQSLPYNDSEIREPGGGQLGGRLALSPVELEALTRLSQKAPTLNGHATPGHAPKAVAQAPHPRGKVMLASPSPS